MSRWQNRKQEGDSARPFFSHRHNTAHRLVAFILRFLKHIGQRWWRKKRSIWDRRHPKASSFCIPHTRGNIPAALYHGGNVKGRQCSRHADLLSDRQRCSSRLVYKFGVPWNNHLSNILKKKFEKMMNLTSHPFLTPVWEPEASCIWNFNLSLVVT